MESLNINGLDSDTIEAALPIVVNAVKALLTIIIGWAIAGMVGRSVRKRMMKTPQIDPTLAGFFSSLVRWAILLIVFIAVLGIFGIQATSLVAVLGAASLAIGLALQGTLSDLAAGMMLILFRPYKLGNFVDIGGTSGTVQDLSLFTTELVTPDNVQIIMPNGKCWGAIITNFSAHDTRRCDLTFGIDYDDNADVAMQVIMDLANADSRVLQDPAPWTRVTNLGDSSVDITARLWCNAADYWDLKFHMTKAVKEAFDAKGISIPYPTTTEIKKSA